MKIPVATILSLGLLLPCAPRAADTVPAAELWNRIDALQKSPAPQLEQVDGKWLITPEFVETQARRGLALGDMLLEFAEKYPQDSRHWEAVIALAEVHRPVYRSVGDVRNEGWKAAVRDYEAQNAWTAKIRPLLEKMIAAQGVSYEQRERAYLTWMDAAYPKTTGSAADLPEFRRRIDVFEAGLPQSQRARAYEWQYIGYLREFKPAAIPAYLDGLKSSSNPGLATWAQGELNTEAMRKKPVAYKFTALDGRAVDMTKMRGKVVLMDFWATWCGPCKEETPNVLANYNKYHDKGFEVVAVSLDSEKDKQKLIDYVTEKKLPWPQHFDGKEWKNEIAANHAITGIPAMFLFDKKGLLVSTNARGEKLAPEIERLLGLK